MRTRRFLIRQGADLGRTIAEARGELHLTQAELAESVGIERTYLSRLEAGSSVLQLDRALKLLRQLGVELHATQLLDDSEVEE